MHSNGATRPSLNLIFLHGALQTKEVFDPLIEQIRHSEPEWLGEIAAIDLPGHGSAESHRSGYRPDDLADYILETVPSSVLQAPTLVVAQSFSGITATTLPERNKNIVGVVMLDTPLRVKSTATSLALLIKEYRNDPDKNDWIPRLLKEFFYYSGDRWIDRSHNYYDYIAQTLVPLVMVTGEIKQLRAYCRPNVAHRDDQNTDGAEPTAKLIVGTHEEVMIYVEKNNWKILQVSAGACFTDEDLKALKERNINNMKIYALRETGHNVLHERNVKIVAQVIADFAAERLAA